MSEARSWVGNAFIARTVMQDNYGCLDLNRYYCDAITKIIVLYTGSWIKLYNGCLKHNVVSVMHYTAGTVM